MKYATPKEASSNITVKKKGIVNKLKKKVTKERTFERLLINE